MTANSGEDIWKEEPLSTSKGSKDCCHHGEFSMEVSEQQQNNSKHVTTTWHTYSFLGIYRKTVFYHRNASSSMLITVLISA